MSSGTERVRAGGGHRFDSIDGGHPTMTVYGRTDDLRGFDARSPNPLVAIQQAVYKTETV